MNSELRTPPLRYAIVGVGAKVLNMHRQALALDAVQLVGATDVDHPRGRVQAAELGTDFYPDHRDLMARTRPDVAVIVTPHPFHAALAIDCMNAGGHVLVEKPMAVHAGQADAMLETSERTGRMVAVNYQMRFRPEIRAARQLLANGELGQIQHVDMRALALRTDTYFRHATWLGTWAGEGGGVLMNQAPHALDVLCYLLGSPRKVSAWTRTALHTIETEDTAHAMAEGADGALWSIHVSTAETGLSQRLEITGTAGTVTLGHGELRYQRFDTDIRDYVRGSDERIGRVTARDVPIDLPAGQADHSAVYQNLNNAIRHGEELVCSGSEGRRALELANAMIYSGQTGDEVSLPLDRSGYAALLDQLQSTALT